MTKVHKKAPIGLRQAENPLIKDLVFPIYWSVCCACFFLLHRFDPVGLLVQIPIVSHLLVAFVYIVYWAFVLVLLSVGVGTVIAMYSIAADILRSSEKKEFEGEMEEKIAEILNKNTELRAALEKVIREKGKNHIETAKIFREIGRNLKRSGIYQEKERCRIYQEAEEAHREALGIYQQILGPKSNEVARTCRHIAELVSGPERGQEKCNYLWRAFLIEKRWVKMTLNGEDIVV